MEPRTEPRRPGLWRHPENDERHLDLGVGASIQSYRPGECERLSGPRASSTNSIVAYCMCVGQACGWTKTSMTVIMSSRINDAKRVAKPRIRGALSRTRSPGKIGRQRRREQ
jgi:hypothetical protein